MAQQPTAKEMGLLKVASKHKHTVKNLAIKSRTLENFLVHCLKKDMDEEKLWEYANEYTQWWKGNSKELGVRTTIKPYTNKKGQTHDAHYTENNEYLLPVDKNNPSPMFYNGYFAITKERFMIKQNPDAKELVDFFQPYAQPVIQRLKMSRPKIVNHKTVSDA